MVKYEQLLQLQYENRLRSLGDQEQSKYRKYKVIQPVLECTTKLELFVLVTSSPENFDRRAAIRESWSRSNSSINSFFFSGKKSHYQVVFSLGIDESPEVNDFVNEEAKSKVDILRLDYTDSYENLTNKTIFSIRWLSQQCSQTRYVLKTDDDVYVNMPPLLAALRTLSPEVRYFGKLNVDMDVVRDPTHPNYVSIQQHPEEFYRPYCAGGGYILSRDTLAAIIRASETIPQIPNEDAYMGMLTNASEIIAWDDTRVMPFIIEENQPGVLDMKDCSWREAFLVHGVRDVKQFVMHWRAVQMHKMPSKCKINIYASRLDEKN